MWLGVVMWTGAPGWAADGESWFGAHATSGLQFVEGSGAGTVLSQVEFDAQASTGPLLFRLDLDYHFDPLFFETGTEGYQIGPHYPLPPEQAMLQIGDRYHLRAGVTSANFGIQMWDEKDNYLPSYSNVWNFQNGQNLGIEPGLTFEDGTELFAFGGYDIAYMTPGFGGGVATEQDVFSTFSGGFYLPAQQYGMLMSANEIYPADWLWLTLELDAGVAGEGLFGGGQLITTFLPEATLGGAIRIDHQRMDDRAVENLEFEVDTTALSAGLRLDPLDTLHLALEGKESWPRGGGAPYFTSTLLVAVTTGPEPE